MNSCARAALSLLLGLFGALWDGAWIILIATVWFGPCYVRAYVNLWKWYFGKIWDSACPSTGYWILALPFFVAANLALTPIAVILWSIIMVMGFWYGLYASVICYRHGAEQAAAYTADLAVGVEVRAVESSIAPDLTCCHGQPGIFLTFVLLGWASKYRGGIIDQRLSAQKHTEAQQQLARVPSTSTSTAATAKASSTSSAATQSQTDSSQTSLSSQPAKTPAEVRISFHYDPVSSV